MATSPRAGKRLVSFINREELSSLEFNISEVERPTKAVAVCGLSLMVELGIKEGLKLPVTEYT